MPPCGSPLASLRQVPTFRTVALSSQLTPPPCRPPSRAEHRCLLDFFPGPDSAARFRWLLRFDFDTSSAVHCCSSSGASPDGLHARLFHGRSPRKLLPSRSSGRFGAWACSPTRGAFPHQLCGMLFQGHGLDLASWHAEPIKLQHHQNVRRALKRTKCLGKSRTNVLPS